jgi:hypothetical protein
MDPKSQAERHDAFFDLERDPRRAALTRPNTLLRTTEWGGLTLVSLLASWAFPPYFVAVMLLAFFNAGGLLWVTHLNEAGRRRLREFEVEFSKGHAMEEAGQWSQAAAYYAGVAPRYQDHPQISRIALHRVEHLRREHPEAFLPARPKKKRATAAVKRSRR